MASDPVQLAGKLVGNSTAGTTSLCCVPHVQWHQSAESLLQTAIGDAHADDGRAIL